VATAAGIEPGSTGLGGDCFALYYDASSQEVTALNGSGRLPGALTLEKLRREGFGAELPTYHPYTITVPGACAGWCDLIERHGRLLMSVNLAPAVRLAEEGYPVAPITALYSVSPKAARHLPALRIDTGAWSKPGEIFATSAWRMARKREGGAALPARLRRRLSTPSSGRYDAG
jgi:gamma-glutamyltranspeptidase/glutathione hydrolase